jgi:hypothetical protein
MAVVPYVFRVIVEGKPIGSAPIGSLETKTYDIEIYEAFHLIKMACDNAIELALQDGLEDVEVVNVERTRKLQYT